MVVLLHQDLLRLRPPMARPAQCQQVCLRSCGQLWRVHQDLARLARELCHRHQVTLQAFLPIGSSKERRATTTHSIWMVLALGATAVHLQASTSCFSPRRISPRLHATRAFTWTVLGHGATVVQAHARTKSFSHLLQCLTGSHLSHSKINTPCPI